MKKISSLNNAVIKEIKLLKNKKYRSEKGQFFIEGERFIEDAVKSEAKLLKIIFSESYLNKEYKKSLDLSPYDTYVLDEKCFRSIADTENPQGILAIAQRKDYDFESIFLGKNRFVILDNIQDPGNMGTIIRTADAAGFSGIILSKGCVDVYNPKVLRSTMGSIFHIPIYFCEDLAECIGRLKERKIKILASALIDSKNYFDIEMNENIGIVIGNEANGISDNILSISDELVKIPMPGFSESLNASVAASILIYESVRQGIKKT